MSGVDCSRGDRERERLKRRREMRVQVEEITLRLCWIFEQIEKTKVREENIAEETLERDNASEGENKEFMGGKYI